MDDRRLRILLVEDDEDDYTLLRDLLAEIGAERFALAWVTTYEEALETIARQQHDVYLVDYRLGEHDGLELVRAAVQQDCRAPLIVLTGQRDHAVDVAAMQAGAADFLTKGQIDAALLERAIRYAIAHKRAEEDLRKSEERFAKAFHASPDAIIITELDGRYIDVNDSFLRFSGYGRDEVIGHTSLELQRWEEPVERARVVQTLHEQGFVRNLEMRTRTKNGELREALVSLELIDLNGEPSILTIIRDVTERKHLEAQLHQTQKMQAIGTLAGGIAHDFNNILSAILGYAELTLHEVPPESTAQRYLHEVLTAGTRAKELVRQILTFSRGSEPERKPVQIHPLVTETLTLLRVSLPATIAIHEHIDPEAGIVLADSAQLRQVLMNLCTNAGQAMHDTGGTLDVRLAAVRVEADFALAHAEIQPGPYVRLTVRDTGHGMAPDVIERIFEPFFTTKHTGEGTGLGLAVTHGIVASHGGVITVDSALGKGTTFEIYLPCLDQVAASDSPAQASVRGGNECILFVDDEVALARLGQAMLEHLGYEVVACTSSAEALDIFRATPQRFDLVITDQTMPPPTGEALARELRRIRPQLPIILCTGFSHTMTEEKARELGLQGFLMKPLVTHDLGVAVRRVLAQQPALEVHF